MRFLGGGAYSAPSYPLAGFKGPTSTMRGAGKRRGGKSRPVERGKGESTAPDPAGELTTLPEPLVGW